MHFKAIEEPRFEGIQALADIKTQIKSSMDYFKVCFWRLAWTTCACAIPKRRVSGGYRDRQGVDIHADDLLGVLDLP